MNKTKLFASFPNVVMTEPRPRDLETLRRKFRNFDDQDVFNDVQKAALDPTAQNFVVLFGPHHAKVALNLVTDDFRDLFLLKDKDCPVRWINFWNTSKQSKAITYIGEHYGFSRRLRASITAWDKYRHIVKAAEARRKEEKEKELQVESQGSLDNSTDVEQGLALEPLKEPSPPQASQEEIINFKIIQESLNYTTTDYGPHFFCFGANWLHVPDKEDPDPRLVPPKHWSWFALCADNQTTDTVVSIHEEPNYSPIPKTVISESTWREKELRSMRSNTLAVLEQLSDIGIAKYNNNLLLLKSIRESLKTSTSPSTRSATAVHPERITEIGASNLFYYLFEDYSATIHVLTVSQRRLNTLSRRVLASADRRDTAENTSDIIPGLHNLGKDLRLLAHLFESYKTLFTSILVPPDLEAAETRVVKLEGQARDRFRRLIDRLQLLMLNTIREHVDEKTELSNTYFSITAQKDSEATARLTRSATLLAKLSVFFLPISFMTSYFSVQIPELTDAYTAKTYWNAFVIVASVSFVCLFFFSKLLEVVSDRLDEASEGVRHKVKGLFRRAKREKKE